MTHDEASELIAALALDAVEGEERATLEAHIAECPRCQSEFDALLEVAAALGNSVEPMPEHLWTSISSRIYDEGDVAAPVLTLFDADDSSSTIRRRPLRSSRVRKSLALPLAVAAVVVAVLAFQLVSDNGRVSNLQSELRASNTSAITAALTAPGHKLVTLKGGSDQKLAEIVMLPDGRGYLVSSKMPTLTTSETYQLWGVFGGKTTSIGLMGSSPGHVTFTAAGPSTPTELAVTIEPAGGAATPTSQIIAAGTV
jgi:anti-sigma-K factor RskA